MNKSLSACAVIALCLMFTNCASQAYQPAQGKTGKGKPAWIDNPANAYHKAYYLSAVGHGITRRQAEQNALGNLVAIFGQTVESNLDAVESYKKQVHDGVIDISSNVRAEQAVKTSASMDSLFAAQIGDRWTDGKTYYAVAVMDKAEGRLIYQGLFDANVRLIDAVLKFSNNDSFSIETVAHYYYAASLADINAVFSTVLSILDDDSRRNTMNSGDYMLEAKKRAQAIPVYISVSGDHNDRVKSAFAHVFAEQGFKTGQAASRYTLRVNINLEPVTLQNQNKWTRYTVDAQLCDNKAGAVLFPFTVTGREGHISQGEADNRAIISIVEKVKNDYTTAFKAYLASAAAL